MKLISLIVVLFFATICHATPITYQFLTFQLNGIDNQYAYGDITQNTNLTLSGNITTDGAIGQLNSNDIVSSTWLTPYCDTWISNYTDGLYATSDGLFLSPGSELDLSHWAMFPSIHETLTLSTNKYNGISVDAMWNRSSGNVNIYNYATLSGSYSNSLEIASVGGGNPVGSQVPEPSTILLLIIFGIIQAAYCKIRYYV